MLNVELRYLTFDELSEDMKRLHERNTTSSYPQIVSDSQVVQSCWDKLGKYFPSFQVFAINGGNQLVGFVNTIPLKYDGTLQDLPDEGWDWLIQKGISDFEQGITANCLGGLQINISKAFRGQGYSALFIAKAKELRDRNGLDKLFIPIRPALKSELPKMNMAEYITYELDGRLYDPWIRTHLRSGAKIIKVCSNSMHIDGDLSYWEGALNQELHTSGNYYAAGCLNEIHIDVENNYGEYREANIWIHYD